MCVCVVPPHVCVCGPSSCVCVVPPHVCVCGPSSCVCVVPPHVCVCGPLPAGAAAAWRAGSACGCWWPCTRAGRPCSGWAWRRAPGTTRAPRGTAGTARPGPLLGGEDAQEAMKRLETSQIRSNVLFWRCKKYDHWFLFLCSISLNIYILCVICSFVM